MWLLVVLEFIWVREHKGDMIFGLCSTLGGSGSGQGKNENVGIGGREANKDGREERGCQRQGLPEPSPLQPRENREDSSPSFGPICHPSPHPPLGRS